MTFKDAPPKGSLCMACNAAPAIYRFPIGDSDIEGSVDQPGGDAKPVRLSMKLRGDWYICDTCRGKMMSNSIQEFVAWLMEHSDGPSKQWIEHWESKYQAAGALMGIYKVLGHATVGFPQCIKDRNN